MRSGEVCVGLGISYQACFRGIQLAIEEKAREFGVPVIYVDPRNTSKVCPVHKAEITYNSRVGVALVVSYGIET